MGQFFSDLITDSFSLARNNLLSALVRPEAELPHGPLTDSELAATCMLLMIAGHETTVNLLGNGLYLLLSHPEQLSLLRDNDSLMSNAIEEILRFESPVQRGTYRCTKESVEVGGILIPAGSTVTALIGSANRDPEIFDNPDTFDILRNPNPHLGFGQGIHFCLGASLARQEASIAFTRLLARLPNLRLQDHQRLHISKRRRLFNTFAGRLPNLFAQSPCVDRWGDNTIVRGLTSLPIVW
jgi:cytochrome P450